MAMRMKKRYSNVSFTKSVDHDAGRHRTLHTGTEPGVCKGCGALYVDRRWINDESDLSNTRQQRWRIPRLVLCPACKKQMDGVPGGFVFLEGQFLKEHNKEIEKLLFNEAERASENNPLARIMEIKKDNDGGLMLATTTEHLAQRLGHALQKAFGGKVLYRFSHENKLTRVLWRRD
jgi:NMD protein affecting ribosome stability and mRNA decay